MYIYLVPEQNNMYQYFMIDLELSIYDFSEKISRSETKFI